MRLLLPLLSALALACAPPPVVDEDEPPGPPAPLEVCALERPAAPPVQTVDAGCPPFTGFNALGRSWRFSSATTDETRSVRLLTEAGRAQTSADFASPSGSFGADQLFECNALGVWLLAERLTSSASMELRDISTDELRCYSEPRLVHPAEVEAGTRFASSGTYSFQRVESEMDMNGQLIETPTSGELTVDFVLEVQAAEPLETAIGSLEVLAFAPVEDDEPLSERALLRHRERGVVGFAGAPEHALVASEP